MLLTGESMSQIEKTMESILSGIQDSNIPFTKLCRLLEHLSFEMRIKGSHHIFYKEGIDEIINLQPDDSKAKAYQVKQVRNIILKYRLEV